MHNLFCKSGNNIVHIDITTYKDMDLNNITIELDALSVVLLMNNNTVNLLMESLLIDCRNLVSKIPNK